MKPLVVVFLLAACSRSSAPPPPSGPVEIVEAPATTDVAALVRAQMAQHRQLVVYVGASWCEPCQQIHDAITSHRLDAEFPGLTLLAFDLDRDAAALKAADCDSPLIPLFAVPDDKGRCGPKREFGGRKDVDNVPLLTGKLHRLLSP